MTVKELGYISAKVTRNTIVTIMPSYSFQKRVLDLLLSFVLILLTFLPMLIVAILIKITAKEKVFYCQNRIGMNGEVFKIFKFKTLKNSDSDESFRAVVNEDPRVTKLGKILRASYFDELPNLFNVLLGEMSIVGPRPHAIKMDDELNQAYPQYSIRYNVKPGVTGLAQINGYKGTADNYEKIIGRIRNDAEYVKESNILLDLKIVYLTFLLVIQDCFKLLFSITSR